MFASKLSRTPRAWATFAAMVVITLGLARCGTEAPLYYPPSDVTDIGGTDTTSDVPSVGCSDSSDCPGGYRCVGEVCEPIETPACEPGSGTCEGNVAVTCNDIGTSVSRVDCGTAVCTAGALGASCLSACDDGNIGCVDAATSFQCTGGERVVTSCEDGTGCVNGACVAQVCDPGARRCVDSATVAICGAAGVTENTVQCALTEDCQSAPAGCACDGGACIERSCVPGARSCDGDDVVECDALGAGTSPVMACEEGTQCRGGACVDDTCESGTSSCAGDVLLRCEGGTFVETDCAAREAYCAEVSDGARCQAWVCQPGLTSCDATGFVQQVCDERGASVTDRRCPEGQYCTAGGCADQECEPGAMRCSGGNSYRCAANGSAFALAERCEEGCADGVCITEVPECTSFFDCIPPANRCDGDVLVTYGDFGECTAAGRCDYSGTRRTQDCAATERICSVSTLSCVDPGGDDCGTSDDCDAGEVCVSGSCAECGADGDCAEGELCVDRECVSCACPDGFICDVAGECVEGDPLSCRSDSYCQDLAETLGGSPDGVGCDDEVGCFERGQCDDGLFGVDVFGAECPEGTTCSLHIDFGGGGSGEIYAAVCKGCDPEDPNSCRDGEECFAPAFGFPDNTPYCRIEGGGGTPFPFP